jgi:hypothetical protein
MTRLRTTRVVTGGVGLTATALLALGGAAARPSGAWLGSPRPVALATALVGGAVLAWLGRRSAAGAWIGLLPLPLLLLTGLPLAGVRACSGPPLWSLALAGVALLAAAGGWRTPRGAFLPMAFVVLLVFAGRSHVEVGPRGDEPHYLMVADSILRDGDLSLERDYAEGRYRTFHDQPLEPHYRVRGKGGAIYSLHAVGLSLLILPAWALAGYAGVTVFMALLAALLAREVREWVRELGGSDGLADALGWLTVLTPPLAHYAGLVFTEVPAALALTFGLRRGRVPGVAASAVGLAAGLLPWLNVRYAPLAVLVLAYALWRRRSPREWLGLLGPALASALALVAYHQVLYGFWDPRRVYGRRPELALSALADGLPGLLLDQEFGLLVYAPLLALALPGVAALWRRDRRLCVVGLLAVGAVGLTAGAWPMWRGGFNPPGRFLVPVAPLLLLAAGLALARYGLTAGAALLVGWSLFTGMGGGLEPRLVHRDRDGTAPFFRELAGAREWTGLLPGFVLGEPDRRRLAAIWGAGLLLAVPWRARPATGRRLAVASLGWALAAQAASSVSPARTGGRDAVRLVGRTALSVPGWRVETDIPGVWRPRDLDWGPLYEPHRYPGGAAIGSRLPLPPGRYELAILAEDLDPSAPAPVVDVLPDHPGAAVRARGLSRRPGGYEATFEVPPGEPAVSLLVRGGGPMLVQELRVRAQAQPSSREAGPSSGEERHAEPDP